MKEGRNKERTAEQPGKNSRAIADQKTPPLQPEKHLNGRHGGRRTARNLNSLSEDEIRRYLIHFSLTNDVLYSVDLQFRLVSVSPSVENSLGYKPEELIGKTLPELGVLHPEDLEKAVEDTAKLLAGKKISPSVYRFITRDGKIRFGETRSAPFVRNGRIETVIAVARDVTKTIEMEQELSKHRAHLEDLVRERTADLLRANEQLQQEMDRRTTYEKALQESEAKYRYLTEKMNDIIWTADLDLRITYDSPSVEKVLGYTPQERQNQTVRDTLTPDSYARAVQALAAEIERDGQEGVDPDRSVKMELEYYHKNGSTVWLEMVGSAIRDNNGRIVGIHGVSRDITGRRKAEEELARYRERLEEIVRERTSELTRVNEQLKREIEEKTSTAVTLRARESDLLQSRQYLEEMNSALKVLLKQRDEDKASMRQNIISNLELNAMPYLDRMESTHLTDLQKAYLAKIRASLSDITSPFTRKISNEYLNLTPSEIQVAGFIKEGKSSKEIASLMNLSHNTIQTHRYNIRIKLGLQNSKESLRSHLISLE
ncbi:MAG TPA: PAS domain S-box protein [Deltaproteobacteria bacterium]|nr:PAS domain S-box protein [Deltaproteobacteria bacterium]